MNLNQKRRSLQIEAVNALEMANYNGIVIAPTGIGKAWILIEALKRINPKGKVWYLCDSEDNRDKTFLNELIKWGAEEWIDRIEFMCYQTACKFAHEKGDVMLCDEADFALTPIYSNAITQNNFKHKVLVSATLNGDKRDFAQMIVPIVYEKHIKEVEDEGLLNKARHFFVNYMLSQEENDQYLSFNRRFRTLLDDSKGNRSRLEMLQIQRKHFLSSLESSKNVCRRLLKKLYHHKENKILVFCGVVEQADAVCQYSYHSKSEYNYLEAFDNGLIRVLAVVSKVDRGQNLKGVNNIVHESPTKSSTKMIQRSGRGRRLDVDEVLDMYYLVPYFKSKWGKTEPTVVLKWIMESTSKMNFKPINYKL